ncbi:carbohydrate kinase family protein [Kitasatospora cathayae]|uniref:Carbohydrate kinase family protein n=1 Tax=Kitasatospora cathayae TaxID=3004092 RepID=A0ABY7PXC5_9ACTN|nr:carbohydrate kinase family protein [Kitasatospora sp. HUAS 3-15]WBP85088.1 carbohydrate kinase family protein [Kitasatospora sp. HUAS 3-15]
MRIAVTGSIATDHLMTFPGRFTDQLLPDRLDSISLSFLADGLEVRRGGVAANIAFGLGVLGLTPTLVGAAGLDFGDYQLWLKQHGVVTDHVRISDTRHTARFVCTTDQDQNQIATFYPGAMSEAAGIDLAAVAEETGGFDLVLVAPDDPEAMLNHTAACRRTGTSFAADPSQQLPRLDTEQARQLLDGARYLFTNAYEAALLRKLTGWSREETLGRVGLWITTLGADGARIESADGEPVTVPAVPVERVSDPTGVGDAFRAGFLAGRAWELPVVRSAQLGCVLAAVVLGRTGTQEYGMRREELLGTIGDTYGQDAAVELALAWAGRP